MTIKNPQPSRGEKDWAACGGKGLRRRGVQYILNVSCLSGMLRKPFTRREGRAARTRGAGKWANGRLSQVTRLCWPEPGRGELGEGRKGKRGPPSISFRRVRAGDDNDGVSIHSRGKELSYYGGGSEAFLEAANGIPRVVGCPDMVNGRKGAAGIRDARRCRTRRNLINS